MLEAEVMTAFHLSLEQVEALSDDRFVDLAGRALYLRQKRHEALEAIIANGVARGMRGRGRRR